MINIKQVNEQEEKIKLCIIQASQPVGCGIAELDKELKEGVLEWIQVLPEYRGKKAGQ